MQDRRCQILAEYTGYQQHNKSTQEIIFTLRKNIKHIKEISYQIELHKGNQPFSQNGGKCNAGRVKARDEV